jgi:hypothetical protein
MKYDEMSDFDINCKVVDVLGIIQDVHFGEGSISRHCLNGEVLDVVKSVDYCNNPSDAWPIVIDNKIAIGFIDGFGWTADAEYHSNISHSCYENPLRAAMIVYLMMQEGK